MEKKKPYHHKDLKNDLIEKGIRLVNDEGVKSFSLRKAAAACGVSHAAPYSHFQSKEGLLDAIQDHITGELSGYLDEIMAEYGKSPDALACLCIAYVVFFIDNPHYFSFLQAQPKLRLDLTFSGDGAGNYKPFEIFKAAADSEMDKSGYPREKRKDAVIALWAFINGLSSLATRENVSYDEMWESKMTDFLKVFKCSYSP
jgi:AcrR family transcriptional regulator